MRKCLDRLLWKRFAALSVFFLFAVSCSGKSNETLLAEGMKLRDEGNLGGAVVVFKKILEDDPNFFEARYQLAQSYYDTGRLEQAEKEFLKVTKQYGKYQDVGIQLARIYLATKRPDPALERATEHQAAKPDDPQGYELAGRAYEEKGNLKAAEAEMRKAVRASPGRDVSKVLLASILVKEDQADAARSILREAIAANKDNPLASIALADLEKRKGNLDAALSLYEDTARRDPKAVYAAYMAGALSFSRSDKARLLSVSDLMERTMPDRPETWIVKGMVRFLDQDYKNALTHFQKAEGMRPQYASEYFLGLTQFRLGNHEQALSQFQRCLDQNPNAVNPRVMLALILLQQKRPADAANEARKAIKSDPSSPLAYNILGSAEVALGNFDAAMESFSRATELDPEFLPAYIQKGKVWLAQGKTEEGESELVRAVEVAPEVLESRLILASYHMRAGRHDKALEVLRKGLSGQKKDAVLYNYMAGVSFAKREDDRAVEYLKKAIELQPSYQTPAFNLGAYYAAKGEFRQALGQYAKILEGEPDSVKALIAAALSAELLKDDAAALAYFQRAAKGKPKPARLPLVDYLVRKGRTVEALAALDEAVAADASDALSLEYKGKLLVRQKRAGEAEETFRKLEALAPGRGAAAQVVAFLQTGDSAGAEKAALRLTEQKPEDPQGYRLLALVHEQAGSPDKALLALDRAPAALRENQELLMQRGGLLQKMKRNDAARDAYEKALRLKPGSPEALFALGALHEGTGQTAKAEQYYRQVLAVSPNHVPTLNNLAYLAAESRADTREAMRLAMNAYRQAPDNPYVLDTIGVIQVKERRYAEAVPVLKKAAEVLKPNPTVSYHLAQAYAGLGDREAAAATLKQCLAMGDFPERSRSAEMLKKLGK